MSMFIIEICMVVSVAFIHTGVAEPEFCSETIPGVDQLILGVDITELDLNPIDGGSIAGLKYPVMNNTCDSNRLWTNAKGKVYQKPLQVKWVSRIGRGSFNSKVTVFGSYKQVKDKMSRTVGLEGRFAHLAFSRSNTYTKIQNRISKSHKKIIFVNTKDFSHGILMNTLKYDKYLLDEYFTSDLKDLKGKVYELESDRKMFTKFIDNYGTHYFTDGTFGGMIRQYIEVNSSYYFNNANKTLQAKAKASFNALMNKLNGYTKYDESLIDPNDPFVSSTIVKKQYYGGNVNLLRENGISDWQPTVDKNPVLLKAKTEPLYKLVADESTKEQLKIAIDQYMMRQYFKEINRELLNARYSNEILSELRKNVTSVQKPDILDVDEFNALDKEIEFHMEIPLWFSENTQLCFKQCTNPEKEFCALPGSYTEKHYEGDKKCMLQWGIKSVGADKWFEKTEICTKYQTNDGNPVRVGMICAPLNNFTVNFEDKARNSRSYDYQWKIQVENPPLWFEISMFCLKWETHGSVTKKHCNGQEFCAVPGKWTDVYRKYSYNGCSMRWSWMIGREDKLSPF